VGTSNPRRADGLEVNEADDGLVIYDPRSDLVHHLNATAALIFDLSDGTRAPDAIADAVGEVFGLADPPRDATLAGLEDLARRRLVHWDGHAGAPG
jgi:hypothetical protein